MLGWNTSIKLNIKEQTLILNWNIVDCASFCLSRAHRHIFFSYSQKDLHASRFIQVSNRTWGPHQLPLLIHRLPFPLANISPAHCKWSHFKTYFLYYFPPCFYEFPKVTALFIVLFPCWKGDLWEELHFLFTAYSPIWDTWHKSDTL